MAWDPPWNSLGFSCLVLARSRLSLAQLIEATTAPPKKKPDPVTSETVVIWGLKDFKSLGRQAAKNYADKLDGVPALEELTDIPGGSPENLLTLSGQSRPLHSLPVLKEEDEMILQGI
ncbi:PREDICTED: transmembrane inner ear expressed protein-like [Sturnus vulgaris]|uniref:transmembrane inner ear expressed protein-like n=1 Tax=Sturnus vulgaris TaxID=9172 RepID=UPI00071A3BF0|nr:PREDICTED: transmembrane inner ear expressed protein-like [Sturnus vulgaris]